MKTTLLPFAMVAMLAAPAFAQDVEAGKKVFNQCQTCHVVANEAGEVLAGKAAKTGPNLYGLRAVSRAPGRLQGLWRFAGGGVGRNRFHLERG